MRTAILRISTWTLVLLSQYDPFYYLGDTSVTSNTQIRDLARSWRNAAISLGIAAIVITGTITAAIYGLAKNPRKVSEAKTALVFKFFILILILSDVWILSTLMRIFDRMNS